jgi:polysaccharide export outer membrane protein
MPQPEPYRVGAPDILMIHVLPDPEIMRTVTVRPDGFVTFDLIGDVKAGGRTSAQIAEDIQRRIGRFKRDANVTVSVEAARSNVVSIFGEVRTVGTLPLTTQTRVSEAIASRGGPTFLAWNSRVRVIRERGDEPEVFQVNLRAIQSGDLATNVLLEGGDIVVVPPTPIGVFGYWIQQLLFPYQQVLGPGLSGAALASELNAF